MYELQQTLLSLSNQQSRIHAQRQQLAEEERRLRHIRQATLRRLRAQQLRETLEEAEIEAALQHILERRREDDRSMKEAVMYDFHPQCWKCAKRWYSGIVNESRTLESQHLEYKHQSEEGHQRQLRIREMLNPSPVEQPVHFVQFQARPSSAGRHHAVPSPMDLGDTPVVDEIPKGYYQPYFASQFIPETPDFPGKRGSRRMSTRLPVPDKTQQTGIVTPNQTLQAFNALRARVRAELSSIPQPLHSMPALSPGAEKALHHHVAKLEDILDDVDAVELPTESEDDAAIARKIRRELAIEIVSAIDMAEEEIDRHRPATPTEPSVTDGTYGESDSEENSFMDKEIQRIIQETLARKKDEEVVSRKSVTVEDVPDAEY
jgi:hypothetical protein